MYHSLLQPTEYIGKPGSQLGRMFLLLPYQKWPKFYMVFSRILKKNKLWEALSRWWWNSLAGRYGNASACIHPEIQRVCAKGFFRSWAKQYSGNQALKVQLFPSWASKDRHLLWRTVVEEWCGLSPGNSRATGNSQSNYSGTSHSRELYPYLSLVSMCGNQNWKNQIKKMHISNRWSLHAIACVRARETKPSKQKWRIYRTRWTASVEERSIIGMMSL